MEMKTLGIISTPRRVRRNSQQGFSLIELAIAMLILTVGLLGAMVLLVTAVGANARSRNDTSAVALAQSTMDRIIAATGSANLTTSITDCNGTQHTVNTAPGGATLSNIATGSAGFQSIDFSQPAVDGYEMLYTVCAAGASGTTGAPQIYDVRWRVDALSSLDSQSQAQMISVAAKNAGEIGNGFNQPQFFVMPITLRALRGN